MNILWLSIIVVLIVLTALLPDDAAIALDIFDLWIRTAWIWIRGTWLRVTLWLRLKWDGSWLAWRLWVIRQRVKYNKNNTTEGNE
jgi:hypothetical protein